ncbi:MAG TPA: glycosyltransferase family 1 protein [Thermoanaerobaculia bacterium]
MKIGLNLTQFIPGRSGGVQSYIESLVRELVRTKVPVRFVLFCNYHTLPLFEGYGCERCEVVNVVIPIPRPFNALGRFSEPAAFWAYSRGLRQVFEGARVDILHFPMGFIVPIGYRGRTVLTSLDLQQEIHPEFFSKKELRWRRKHYLPSARKATHIITISDYTAKSLSDVCGIPRERITTVYPGCEEDFFQSFDGSPRPTDLPDRFFFYPAAFWPHKNHRRLFQAVALLRKQRGFKLPLLLCGMNAADDTPARVEVHDLGLEDQVTFLGYISRERLRLLYRYAAFMVFPSLFEGFGIPVVEAMAAGCPVATSPATSLLEIVGADGFTFDPESVESIASAIHRLDTEPYLRRQIVDHGRRRARLFTGEKMARQTLAVYETAVAASQRP